MRKFISWIWRRAISGVITGIFLVTTVLGIVYALSYPVNPPTGEIAGGSFMNYFNKIFQICPAWQVLSWYDVNTGKICVPMSWWGQSSWIDIYTCPIWTAGWGPGGAWAFYWCQWQIGTNATCTNIEYPNTQVRNCTYIWVLWKA